MAKEGCKRAPEINGELSTLYLDLFSMLTLQYRLKPEVARQLTNVLYVHYASNSLLRDSLDNANKARNSLDQHSAADVFQALNGDELVKYSRINELDTLSISEGIKLDTIHSVEFDTWLLAYLKAHDINTMHSTLSAYVVQRNGKYLVKVANMNSLNMVDRVNTEIELKQMQLAEAALASVGASLDSISFNLTLFFGKKYGNLINWLKNVPMMEPKHFLKTDLKMLLSLFQGELVVDRLITKFGSIDSVADIYYDWYRGNYTATPSTLVLLDAAMDLMHNLNGLDSQALYTQSNDLADNIKQNSPDYKALQLYDTLNAKFKLAQTSVEVSKENLSSITNVLAYTIKSLGMQAEALKANGDKQASQDLYDKIRALDRDLELKENSSGIAEFLSYASDLLSSLLDNLITQIPLGADMNFIHERGGAIRRANQFLEVYKPIIESITNFTAIDRDIDISDQDALTLANEASRLNKIIIEINQAIGSSIEAWAKLALSLMLVENSEITIDDVMENIKHDATWFDRLYNATKVSHIPTAVLANFILTTRRQRTALMAEVALRIGAIVNQVDSTGKTHRIDTSIFYESAETLYSTKENPQYEWKIISEYDWTAFNKAKGKQEAKLRKKGYSGQAFDAAMERWMYNNTDEIVVDPANGRVERVPKLKKATNPLDSLSPWERKAYNEFLALKAEIDSMLPEFARSLYTPPQLRMSAIDKLSSSKNPLVNIGRALKEKYQKELGVREDEVGMGQVRETDSGEIITPYTDMTGSENIVPVNYVLKLREQDDLLLNLAEGISHLAESAINYKVMSEIVDTVEVLGDYLSDQVSPEKNGADMAQGFLYGTKLFFERLKKGKADSVVSRIIEDLKKRLLYNDITAGRDIKTAKRLALLRKITSINALTFNLFGAINNALEGYRKNLEEALVYGTHTFDLIDLEMAHAYILKEHVGKTGSHLVDFFTGKKTTLGALIMQRFDPKKEKFHEIANKKYRYSKKYSKYKTHFFRMLMSRDLKMIGYSIGETLNNMPIVYARLFHEKISLNGQTKGKLGLPLTLMDALERLDNGDGTYRLGIKEGATLLNGQEVTEEHLDQVAREINEISETNHGGMSDEAMGEIATSILGMMTLLLRRWMIGVYSNYFRGEYFDASTGKKREGAWKGIYDVSFAPVISAAWKHMPWSEEFAKDTQTLKQDIILNYKNLKPYQKLAAVRWLTATSLMTTLSILTDALLKSFFKSDRDEEWFKIIFYLLSRQKMEVGSTVPDLNHIERIGQVGENLVEIMDKPYAASSTVKGIWGLVSKLDQKGETIEQGPHAGEDRYWRHVRKTLWKPGELWYRIQGLEDTDELINSLGGLEGRFSAKKEYEKLLKDEYGEEQGKKKAEKEEKRHAKKKKAKEKKKKKD